MYMIHSKRSMSAAPATMNAARITSAPKMPQNSTRCCSFAGTLKNENTTRNTKTLSTDSAFSMRYPVTNCSA